MFNAIDYDNESDILYPNIKVYDPGDSGSRVKEKNKTKKNLQLNLSSEELDTFCLYVHNLNSDVVTHSALVNAKTMFDLLDMKPYNVNDELLTDKDIIVSAASCTTNCLAPVSILI